MKIWVMAKKETRVSKWTRKEEVDEVETSFDYLRLLKSAEESLQNLGKEYEIDLEKLTANFNDEHATTNIQIIIKHIEI